MYLLRSLETLSCSDLLSCVYHYLLPKLKLGKSISKRKKGFEPELKPPILGVDRVVVIGRVVCSICNALI